MIYVKKRNKRAFLHFYHLFISDREIRLTAFFSSNIFIAKNNIKFSGPGVR